MAEDARLCRKLAWDSKFWGRSIARLEAERLTAPTLERALAWCRSRHIDCLYFLADASDRRTADLARSGGFRAVDDRVVFTKRLAPSPSPGALRKPIRFSRPGDVPALRAIARKSHGDARFYHDPRFPAARCGEFYATWIENSCGGFSDAVLVCAPGKRPIGYVSCHRDGRGRGRIGLFAVDAAAHRRGFGKLLVEAALSWFAGQGVETVTVATQRRNKASMIFYSKRGFALKSTRRWYHLWLSPPAPRRRAAARR
ncbi:MAG: GNAT family N-acetyltransferase [Elusimicrobiota bacterium]